MGVVLLFPKPPRSCLDCAWRDLDGDDELVCTMWGGVISEDDAEDCDQFEWDGQY